MARTPNTKAYQWEYMDLEPGVHKLGTAVRGAYLDHVADWAPRGRTTRDCTWVASWAELGVTGTWPRAVSLWEHGSLAVLARRLEMAQNVHQAAPEDKALEAWVEKARSMRHEIVCKLLMPAPWSPTLEELVARKVTGGIYYQQTVKTVPRRVEQYLAALEGEGLAVAQGLGMRLVGAFRTGLCNDSEAVVIWALDDFDHWAAVENANRSDAVRRWRGQLSGVVRDWENVLLMPAPKAPLQTGRDPLMANSGMYLWESVKVTEGLRNFGARAMQDYQSSIAEWAPVGVERGMTLVATWGVCGVVGPYPWCLNLWEYPAGWQGLAQMNNTQFRSPGGSQSTIDLDAKLVDWFARANKLRSFVYDRMLAPSPQTPTLRELLKDKVSGNAYYHEIVKIAPGRVEEYQQRLHAEWQPAAERLGMQLIGCYRTELRNDCEAVNLWALRDFAHWAELEGALRSDADARRWVASTEGLVDDWQTWLLMPYPKSPLQTGFLP